MNVHLFTFIVLLLLLHHSTQSTTIFFLENCRFQLDFYRTSLNLLWSSNDSRSLHVQTIYSLPSNQTRLHLGQISHYQSQSVGLIPFLVQCSSYPSRSNGLPFSQCSSRVRRNSAESTRTNLRSEQIPLLYIGESTLFFSNCSFQSNGSTFQMHPDENFSIRVEFETPIGRPCRSCNQRTSICRSNQCQCRSGTIPLKLQRDEQFCIDMTTNCSFDRQRCLYSTMIDEKNSFFPLIFVGLIVFIGLLISFFGVLLFYLCRTPPMEKEFDLNQSIYTIDRTPSTISTNDSLKFDRSYPKILAEDHNGDFVMILV